MRPQRKLRDLRLRSDLQTKTLRSPSLFHLISAPVPRAGELHVIPPITSDSYRTANQSFGKEASIVFFIFFFFTNFLRSPGMYVPVALSLKTGERCHGYGFLLRRLRSQGQDSDLGNTDTLQQRICGHPVPL